MLLAGYLPVLRCGVEAGMPEVLLKKPQSISGVVCLHGAYIEEPLLNNEPRFERPKTGLVLPWEA